MSKDTLTVGVLRALLSSLPSDREVWLGALDENANAGGCVNYPASRESAEEQIDPGDGTCYLGGYVNLAEEMATNNAGAVPRYPVGLWTPWAKILCYACHGATFRGGKTLTAEEFTAEVTKREVVLAPTENHCGQELARCDECDARVIVSTALAREQGVARFLSSRGWTTSMDQTGGMCSAVSVELPGKGEYEGDEYHDRIMITVADDFDGFVVGLFLATNPCEPADWADVDVSHPDAVLREVTRMAEVARAKGGE